MSTVRVDEHHIAVTDPGQVAEILTRARAALGSGKGAALVCPCGQTHDARLQDYAASVSEDLGAFVDLAADGVGYRISRLYLLAHGLKAEELPELARQGLITVQGGPQA